MNHGPGQSSIVGAEESLTVEVNDMGRGAVGARCAEMLGPWQPAEVPVRREQVFDP